jgi:hypothetical protein
MDARANRRGLLLRSALPLLLAAGHALAMESSGPVARQYALTPPAPERQTPADVRAKSLGCTSCHSVTDHATMHINPGVLLGCTDCHGGDARVANQGAAPADAAYRAATDAAHVLPKYPAAWNFPSSANPERSYTLLNREAPEFVRFVNPGDYRVVREACGACHLTIIQATERRPARAKPQRSSIRFRPRRL